MVLKNTGEDMWQHLDQAIDIADWQRDEELTQYPEGARDKVLLYCPDPAPYGFLKAGHQYFFKLSSSRYPEQFWMEIFAYILSIKMGIEVPPAFVAYDSNKNKSGALIEWFLKSTSEKYIAGGDYCQRYFQNFDRKKGAQHNFEMIVQIFSDLERHDKLKNDWKVFWAKALVFDALIGNTDRHQDNWGIIKNSEIRIAPVFDNGTSMGHEIFSKNFHLFETSDYIEKYVSKGKHHMKWSVDNNAQGHCDLLQKLISKYPETRAVVISCLNTVNNETFKNILDNLAQFKVPTQLSMERACFMLKLLKYRHQRLLNKLEK